MYADIGGMDIQKQEVREAVELPLTHFELYKQVRHMDAKKCTAWPKQNCCCCGWSGLGSATSYVQRMRSTDYLNILNDHIILSLDFVCSESTGMFQDENPGFFMLKLWNWFISSHGLAAITPLRIFEKVLHSGLTFPSSLQELGEIWMQHWMNILQRCRSLLR